MAEYTHVETHVVSATTTPTYADFGSPPLRRVYVHSTDANCHIDFDTSPDTSTSFLLPADTVVEFNVNCNKVYLVMSSATSTVYVMGVR